MKKQIYRCCFLLLMAGSCACLLVLCGRISQVMSLRSDVVYTAAFRRQSLTEDSLEDLMEFSDTYEISPGRALAVWMAVSDYRLRPGCVGSKEEFIRLDTYFQLYRPEEYTALQGWYQAIWEDAVYFPVDVAVTYEDSWMYERTYGGKRGHEGTDLMPPQNRSGIYPIYSMTAGTVENIGWLDKGGYRIGIRGEKGGYFYYAHLSSYASAFAVGEQIEAGELIGYMGDSGYGSEGTTGKFDVHLHFGIYITLPDGTEVSVNPYWVLKSLESHKLKCRYYVWYNRNY